MCNSTRILGSRYACKIFHVNRCRGEKAAARYKRNNINEGEEAEVGGPQHPPDSVAEGRRGRKGYKVLTVKSYKFSILQLERATFTVISQLRLVGSLINTDRTPIRISSGSGTCYNLFPFFPSKVVSSSPRVHQNRSFHDPPSRETIILKIIGRMQGG